MEIEGKIIRDIPMQSGVSKAGNQWKKKEWVLETFGQYPRQVKFDFFGDRADQNQLQIGQSYAISFDLESREFNGRWYTDVRAYASRPLDQAQNAGGFPGGQSVMEPPMQQPQPFGQPQQFGQPEQGFGSANDDLPF